MEMIRVASSGDVHENTMCSVRAGKAKLLLTRVDGEVYAFANRCPHLGLPLEKGRLQQGVITCPWHNSSFDVRTGENVDWCTGVAGKTMPSWTRRLIAMGKTPRPLTLVEVKEEAGAVFVKSQD